MRRRALALIVGLTGCGYMTDGLPPELGRCADPTNDWWPLHENNRWVYDVMEMGSAAKPYRKDWLVQGPRAPILGLAGPQEGVRIWRGEETEKAGWRWFVDEDSAIWFRRDVWLDGARADAPCGGRPDDDVRLCDEATFTEEDYYLPGRKRLDYSRDRVCEGSAWSESYVEWAIPIGTAGCSPDDWRSGMPCVATPTEVVDHWSVAYIARRIEVPAGVFENCLCVRRIEVDWRDVTYCYAKGVGKVFELDRGRQVECLAQYCVYGGDRQVCVPDVLPLESDPCDEHQLDN